MISAHGTADIRIKLEPKVIKNETDAIVTRMIFKLGVENGRINIGNLLEDGVLNDLINSSLNDNFGIISMEISPLDERLLQKTIKKLVLSCQLIRKNNCFLKRNCLFDFDYAKKIFYCSFINFIQLK